MCLGIPGQIIEICDRERKLAVVEISGVRREVNVACIIDDRCVDELIGVWSLIHAGFAMSRIDEQEALLTLDILYQLGEAQEEINAMQHSAAMLETSS